MEEGKKPLTIVGSEPSLGSKASTSSPRRVKEEQYCE
jgi:hypothetical protein